MKEQKWIRKAGLVSVLFALSGWGILSGTSSAQANAFAYTLPSSVHVGDSVKIPLKTLTKDGVSKVASSRILTPSGLSYSSTNFLCDEAGQYQVIYSAQFTSGIVSETSSFLSIRRPSDMFKGKGGATFANASFPYLASYKGVLATFPSGGQATFNKILDLTSASKDDALIDLMVLPSTEGASDFTKLTLTLTDVEDESKTITVTFSDGGGNIFGRGCYLKAAANGQVLSGWEFQQLHTESEYGTPIESSFRGLASSVAYRSMALYYDNAEKCIYASPSAEARSPKKTVIVDFDDKASFPTSLWSGFTSNKVRMTIAPSGLTSPTAQILFHSVGSFDLSEKEFVDSSSPSISINTGTETTTPSAVVGYDYPLFSAEASDDFDDDLKVERKVNFLDPTTKQEIALAVNEDKFRVLYNGEYHVIYSASDRSGNTASKTLTLFTSTSVPTITINGVPTSESASVFSSFTLPSLSSLSTTGGYGTTTISRTVFDPSGKEVSVTNNAFIPENVGDYTITYTAKDYLGFTGSLNEKLTVKTIEGPAFVGEVSFPDAYLKGFAYSLPSYSAKEIVNGLTNDVPVSISVNGSDVTSNFVASGDKATLVYTAKGQSGNLSKSFVVPVRDGNQGKAQDQYFYGANVTVSEERNDVLFSASQDGRSVFLNPLSSNHLNLVLNRLADKENLASFGLYLQDGKDLSKHVTLSIRFASANSALISFPGQIAEYSASAPSGLLSLSMNSLGEFSDASTNGVGKILYDDSGDAFEAFSDTVYAGIVFQGVKGESAIQLTSLNGQPMGYRSANVSRAKDSIKPTIELNAELAQKFAVGSSITVPSARSYDVLNPVTSFTLSVSDPSGNILLNNEDPSSEKKVTLSSYGQYHVSYSASDAVGNTLVDDHFISVVEYEKPTLSVDFSTLKSSYALNAAVTLPTASVSDNSGSYYLDIFLVMPDNEMRLLSHHDKDESLNVNRLDSSDNYYPASFKAGSNAFYVLTSGKYTLRYFAYDDYFNNVTKEFSFVVVK